MRGRLGTKTTYKHILSGTRLCNNAAMNSLISQDKFSGNEVAQFRLKVIEFHKSHGTKTTKQAYGISKPTIYRWRKKLKDSKGRLSSLIPESKTPKTKRIMETHPMIIKFIKVPKRIYHNPNSKWATKKINYKTRVKHSPKPKDYGYLQIDTIEKFVDGIKFYIFNAVDIKLKFDFAYEYSRKVSRNAKDFYKKLELVYPIQNGVKTVQTDNGSEYHGEFSEYLKNKGIKQVYIYPRCPKINAFVERANRTLQEEFFDDNQHLVLEDISEFNSALMDYLVWYNTKRVHKSLGNITPIDYLLFSSPESHMYVTYTTS
jgi:transposase InsO family protein